MTILNPITISSVSKPIIGEIRIIGDKSVSFRSLFFAAMTDKLVKIKGLNNGDDIKKTVKAFQDLGVEIELNGDNCKIRGTQGILKNPHADLDLGGSATAARLFMGLLSTQNFASRIHGNDTLNKRSMNRVTNLLQKIGANIELNDECRLPATIKPGSIRASNIEVQYPSAQIQTSLILALLMADGESTIKYSSLIRDHTEKMMQDFKLKISLLDDSNTKKTMSFFGQQYHNHKNEAISEQEIEYQIFGDPSMTAYFVVGAIIVPGSDLLIRDIYIQANRTGYLEILKNMGADIEILNIRKIHNEEVADIRVRYSKLKAIEIRSDIAPRMIDEYPIIAVAASFAKGKTIMRGVEELKAKESNRMLSISQCLGKLGVHFDLTYDSMSIIGLDEAPEGGTDINSFGDHRIVMSFAILGLMANKPITINDISSINATFPNFFETLKTRVLD